MDTVEAIAEHVRQVSAEITHLQAVMQEKSEARTQALRWLHRQGLSGRQIADLTGLSWQRVYQLL